MEVQMGSRLQSTLPNVLTFCAAFEQGGFSKAARILGVTPQAASRSVLRLEETLGVTLFRRTTRRVTPTDAARAYYVSVNEALGLLRQAEAELSTRDRGRSGLVRLSVPTTFGHHRLLPMLAGFRDRYPGIGLEIDVGNRNVDFTAEGYAFAIRLGAIRETGLIARKLGDFPLGVYGAPAYLARHSIPRTPAELSHHTCIGFVMPRTGRLLPWTFVPGPRAWVPQSSLRCTEDVLATVTLARAGLGLIQTYDFLVERDVAAGTMVEVLREFRGASRPFSLIYPAAPQRSATARLLIDFLLGVGRVFRRPVLGGRL
jgi:DNA-binding transcriptional LysR family regulator